MSRKISEVGALLAVLVVAGYVLWTAREWPLSARLFPSIVGVAVAGITLLQLAITARGPTAETVGVPSADADSEPLIERTTGVTGKGRWGGWSLPRSVQIVLWTLVFFCSVMGLGFRIGGSLAAVAFLWIAARERPVVCATYGVVTYGVFLLIFDLALKVPFFPGALPEFFGMGPLDAGLRNLLNSWI